MKLYIGGAYQGKFDLAVRESGKAAEKICRGDVCGEEDIYSCTLCDRFHLYVKRFLDSTEAAGQMIGRLERENKEIIILCDEVGSGIVPLQKEDREYRELVGRSLVKLAALSGEVIRVTCGIGVRIK